MDNSSVRCATEIRTTDETGTIWSIWNNKLMLMLSGKKKTNESGKRSGNE